MSGGTLDGAMRHSAQTLGRIEFGEALQSSKLKVVITAAALRIQMMCRARSARRRVAERKARIEAMKMKAAA